MTGTVEQWKPVTDRIAPGWLGAVECGLGWQELVLQLDRDIAAVCPGYEVHQCKEKFGGLRYYIGMPEGTDERTQAAVQALTLAAEEKSFTICETCGAPATNTVSHHWYVTLCERHLAEREATRIGGAR